jgi:uncharacterized protein with ATP-grasp and redox domains
MSMAALRRLPLEEADLTDLFGDILTIPALGGGDWKRTSPEIIEAVMGKITDRIDDPDPFRAEKTDLNNRAMGVYPFLENLVTESTAPLYTAAKIAILGNSIDFMMPGGTANLERFCVDQLDAALSQQAFAAFQQKLSRTKRILYVGDNCGEIVFDKLFIQTLKEHHDVEVVFAVRSMPTLNDVTIREAHQVGLDQVARLIENGIDGRLPGTVLKRCSAEMRSWVARVDLIISKGGGNFDSLEEELGDLNTDLTFMLLSKCRPLIDYFGIDLHRPIMANVHRD